MARKKKLDETIQEELPQPVSEFQQLLTEEKTKVVLSEEERQAVLEELARNDKGIQALVKGMGRLYTDIIPPITAAFISAMNSWQEPLKVLEEATAHITRSLQKVQELAEERFDDNWKGFIVWALEAKALSRNGKLEAFDFMGDMESNPCFFTPYAAGLIYRDLVERYENGSLISLGEKAGALVFQGANGLLELRKVETEEGKRLEVFLIATNPDIVTDLLQTTFAEAQPRTITITQPPPPKDFLELFENDVTAFIKQGINNFNRLEKAKSGRITKILPKETDLIPLTTYEYSGSVGSYALSFDASSRIFEQRIQNGVKIFNFLLMKLNEQNFQEKTEFMLQELIDLGIYSSPASAYKGLKSVLQKLSRIDITGKVLVFEKGKSRERGFFKAALISAMGVTYKKCGVILPPILRESARYFTVFPEWGYSLKSEPAFFLLDYIFYLARQNVEKIAESGGFNIRLETIRERLGLPTPEEVKKDHKSNYNTLIIEPIDTAITAIEERQRGEITAAIDRAGLSVMTLTPVYEGHEESGSIDINKYLNGYLRISFIGEPKAYFEERAKDKITAKKKATRSKTKKKPS